MEPVRCSSRAIGVESADLQGTAESRSRIGMWTGKIGVGMGGVLAAIEPWHCIACGHGVETKHCPTCGERSVRAKDLTLRRLLVEVLHTLTHLDSRLVRSLRYLLFRPGTLTVAYLEGPRKPYISPFQLFLTANVIFFAVQSVTTVKVFSAPLASHLQAQDWSPFARRLVTERLAEKGLTLEAFTAIFDRMVAVNAKSLVILMAVPFVLLLIVMFRRSGRPFLAHVTFALHFYAFHLLILSAMLLVMLAASWIAGPRFQWSGEDVWLFAIQLLLVAIYLYAAINRVYRATGVKRAVTLTILVTAVGAAISGYRFLMFLVTLYGI